MRRFFACLAAGAFFSIIRIQARDGMRSLGIDIGGSSAKLALVENDAPLGTAQSPFYSRPDINQLVAALKSAAADKLLAADCSGICVPGLLDREKRAITLSVNVPGLMGVTLDQIVSRAFGDAVPQPQIINDAV